jgi:predicted GIY-YIG superfamily endonuclease
MLSVTIQEALQGDSESAGHVLYVIRDRRVIFYVGRSVDPLNRLEEHLGHTGRNMYQPDRIGQLILKNHPASLIWTIDLYTLEERHSKEIGLAESELIHSLDPCLNFIGNKNRTPLPLRYIKESAIANEGVILE